MRLQEILAVKARARATIQPLPEGDFSESVGIDFRMRDREPLSARLKRRVARSVLRLLQPATQRRIGLALPVKADLVTLGERFANEAALARLLSWLRTTEGLCVLVPGCYIGGEDIQFWLRHGAGRVEGIDVYALDRQWSRILPELRARWHSEVEFRQGSIEDIPFENDTFDVVASSAVLEHVRNLEAMTAETARVLRPGGYALHLFGPLYYCFGADHCIASYGEAAGYDHLLLDAAEYRAKIEDRTQFEMTDGNPDLAFWALNDQFSFSTAAEYLQHFQKHFEVLYTVVKISPSALAYRERFPEKWRRLLDAQIDEADLMVKSLCVLLRKPR